VLTGSSCTTAHRRSTHSNVCSTKAAAAAQWVVDLIDGRSENTDPRSDFTEVGVSAVGNISDRGQSTHLSSQSLTPRCVGACLTTMAVIDLTELGCEPPKECYRFQIPRSWQPPTDDSDHERRPTRSTQQALGFLHSVVDCSGCQTFVRGEEVVGAVAGSQP